MFRYAKAASTAPPSRFRISAVSGKRSEPSSSERSAIPNRAASFTARTIR
jgi:hypothetical protein